jgi:hypothetical protein
LGSAPIEGETGGEYVVPVKNKSLNVRAELARVAVGRMFLHVACAMKDGRVQWHWEGIKRELPQPHRMWRMD